MFANQDLRNDYVGNGSAVNYAFTFPVYDDDDVQVLADGVVQTKGTHYNVRNAGDTLPFSSLTASQLPADGIIKFVTAPASGVKIALLPLQALQQSSDYVVEPFPADRVERDFDKVVMLVRVLTEKMRRALKFATKSLKLDADGTVDDPVAGKFLRAKDPGPGMDWATPVNAGALSSPVAIADGGTGATTAAGARTNLDVPSNAEVDAEFIAKAIVDAKGDLIAATAADTPARVAVGANRTLLEADSAAGPGVAWAARALGLKSMQVFTANGTWNRPTGIRKVLVMVVGGGGGGGGCLGGAAGDASGSGGGGGGGCAVQIIDVSAIASSTITVGGGGAGGAAGPNAGTGGTASSWADGTNTVTGNGGAGGTGVNTNTAAPGGGGGSGTAAGGLVIRGGVGGGGFYNSTGVAGPPAEGGSSHLGGGASSPGANTAGANATANTGGGGSGALDHGTATNRAGGNGGSGVVVVYEYE